MDFSVYSVGLKVVDFPKVLAFYRDVIGLKVARVTETEKRRLCYFETGGAPLYLIWDAPRPGDRPPADRIRTRVELAVADVDEAWKRISAHVPGANGPPHPTAFGWTGFSLKDPEGTTIHVLQDPARAQAPAGEAGR